MSKDAQCALPLADVYLWRMRAAKVKAACRAIAEERTFAKVAGELDSIFCAEGRPVSTGTLHNTLDDNERNYLRAEWLPVLSQYSDEIAETIANAAGKTLAPLGKLRPEDELELLKERVMREFGAAGARLVAGNEAARKVRR